MPHHATAPHLPPASAPASILAGFDSPARRWSPAPTMLLVEDSRHTAEVFRLVCRRAAVRLRRADSLAVARAHLRVYRPDLVVVDLGLPDGCGLDLIRDLAGGQPRPARIIAISGDSARGAAALAAGAHLFLAKPLQLTGANRLGLALNVDAGSDDGRTRNAGADPLALADDLRHACALIDRAHDQGLSPRLAPDPAGQEHAVQFAHALAVSLGDDDLRAASLAGDLSALRAALSGRLHRLGMI